MRFTPRFVAVFAAVLLIAAPAQARRVALVAGAGAYESVAALPNAVGDAQAMHAALTRLGFDSQLLENPNKAQFRNALSTFAVSASGADAAVIFFSGHGFTMADAQLPSSQQTRLLPIGAQISHAAQVGLETPSVADLEGVLQGAAGLKLVILDACRENTMPARITPSPGSGGRLTRSITRGLTRPEPSRGVVVWYAAQDGALALDGQGANSPFTAALLRYLEQPGLEFDKLFRRVTEEVLRATGQFQRPYEYGSRTGADFYFASASVAPARPPADMCAYVEAPFGQECYMSGGRVRFRPVAAAPMQPTPAPAPAPVWTSPTPVDPCAGQTMTGFECRNVNGQPRFFAVAAASTLTPTPQPPTPAATPTVSAAELNRQGMAAYSRGDHAEALRLHRKAADQGNADGMYAVGYLYRKGHGVAQDYTEAMRWYRQAADRGSAVAMYNIGWLYERGLGVTQDYTKAMRWYRQAADRGDAAAMYNIGSLYDNGNGVAQDNAAALRWFRQAADRGNASAMNSVGYLYQHGHGVEQDYAEALRWYRQAADRGKAEAITNIGGLYEMGLGVAQDYAEAMRWYRQAADRGEVVAMYNIGWLYERGLGVTQDYTKAMRWYRQAADQGDASAMYNIGYLYRKGHGVAQDYTEAMHWYRQAADRGNAEAMNNIALLYVYGRGVTQNYDTAAQWFMRALRRGHDHTRNILINQAPAPVARALQQQLRNAGVYSGPINGQFDTATRAAIDAIFGKGE